jgi:hypothetical protein
MQAQKASTTMAANTVETQVEGETIAQGTTKAGRAQGRRIGIAGVAAVLLIALALSGGSVLRQRASHSMVPASTDRISSAQMKFLENNTTNMPNTAPVAVQPRATGAQERFLEVNTDWLPTSATDNAPAAMTSAQRWFYEVNTTMLPQAVSATPQAESVTPLIGQKR